MQLPLYKTDIQEFSLLQTKWKSILDPVLGNVSLQSILLPEITLIDGATVINHRLGRKLIGWRIVRQRAAAMIYDLQDVNQSPQLTLVLSSNALVVVDLEVF